MAMVERLVEIYDEVATTRVPKWISLEAPSGWGKTRLIHELYRRLAAERQDAGLYWPPSILDGVAPRTGGRSLDTVANRRKRIFPERVTPAPDALPAWMWLGIGCSSRAGSPIQALADDLTQFEQHQAGIERRWQRDANPGQKLRRIASGDKAREAAAAGVGEAVGATVGVIANASVPGLGFVLLAARWSVRSLRHRAERPEQVSQDIDAAATGRVDLVNELAPALANLAEQVVPLVIVVEDIHVADESLVEVLRRILVARKSRVILVTTAWPALLDEPARRASSLLGAVEPSRLLRLRSAAAHDEAQLLPLEVDARRAIARTHLMSAPEGLIDAVADRYTNPFAIELVASLPRLQRALRTGSEAVAIVQTLPTSVRRLFEEMWVELPEDLRRALMLGALTTPAAISDTAGASDVHWDGELLRTAVEAVGWLRDEVGELDDDLDHTGAAYAWVRLVDDWLRRFHEPAQYDTAIRQGQEAYGEGEELKALYEAIAARVHIASIDNPSRRLHRARLLLALESEGFIGRDQYWLEGLLEVCNWLSSQPDAASARQLVAVGKPGAWSHELSGTHTMRAVRHHYAKALRGLGRVKEAIAQFEALLDDYTRVLGPDDPDTLNTRGHLAFWLGRAGRVEEAIAQFEALLDDYTRVLGPDDPDTLNTRGHLAFWLGRAGRVEEAIAQYEALLDDHTRVLGPDAPDTLGTRRNLAFWVGQAGRMEEAIAQFEALLDDYTRVFGPDAPDTLTFRNHLAFLLGLAGREEEAIAQFEALLDDYTRVLGPDAPTTLTIRSRLAFWLGQAGRKEEAIAQYEARLDDYTRVLGPDAPDTLTTRWNLAVWLGEAGLVEEAIAQYEARLDDYTRVLGPDAPDTLTTAATWLSGSAKRNDRKGGHAFD